MFKSDGNVIHFAAPKGLLQSTPGHEQAEGELLTNFTPVG